MQLRRLVSPTWDVVDTLAPATWRGSGRGADTPVLSVMSASCPEMIVQRPPT